MRIAQDASASGSVSDPDPVDLDSESRRAKITHQNRKKLRNFMFWSAECSLLRAEGLSYSLPPLWSPRDKYCNFWYQIFFLLYIFFQFLFIKTLDADPDRYPAYNAGFGSEINESRSETLASGIEACVLRWPSSIFFHKWKFYILHYLTIKEKIHDHDRLLQLLCGSCWKSLVGKQRPPLNLLAAYFE